MNANLSKSLEIARTAAGSSVREYFRPLIIAFRCITWLLTRQHAVATSTPVDDVRIVKKEELPGVPPAQEKPSESIKGS